MPVLPDVPSMIVPPGLSRPAFSASSIIRTAIRSLIELPGLNVSIFASTVASMTPRVMRLMRTIGVSPMTSRMFPATLRTVMIERCYAIRVAVRGFAGFARVGALCGFIELEDDRVTAHQAMTQMPPMRPS